MIEQNPIRIATLADLPRLVEIYNQAIAARNATADTIPFTPEQRLDWFQMHVPNLYPIYVYADQSGQVAGYLSVSPYRSRPALNRTAEVSYYVDYKQRGIGIGSTLLGYAIQDAPRINKKVYIAILLEWNEPSQYLLEKFGFEKWGYLPDVAEFDGQICAHLYYGRKV